MENSFIHADAADVMATAAIAADAAADVARTTTADAVKATTADAAAIKILKPEEICG